MEIFATVCSAAGHKNNNDSLTWILGLECGRVVDKDLELRLECDEVVLKGLVLADEALDGLGVPAHVPVLQDRLLLLDAGQRLA
jgi:hypothetical protein